MHATFNIILRDFIEGRNIIVLHVYANSFLLGIFRISFTVTILMFEYNFKIKLMVIITLSIKLVAL